MAGGKLEVTFNPEDFSRLPDSVTEGAVQLLDLRKRDQLDELAEHVRIRREGGFCGLDVWLTLLVFFATGAGVGFKKFWQDAAGRHSRQLGALVGRKKLVSPSSLSRALDAVELELLRPAAGWLLAELPGLDEVLKHPAVRTYDTLGEGWHVFDVDPTVKALRHRALPVGEELPEPSRRSEATAAPGYKGRKRGDVVFRQATVQHAGSGGWLHAQLAPGNRDSVGDFARCLDSIVATCERIGHPLERALVRMDGEHGNVPWYAACRERGLPFVTRLNRPKLYEDPEVLARLRAATWTRVEDSGAGPQRSAADLGVLTLSAGQKTRRPDGSAYEPIAVRVVACIFPKQGKAKRGRTLDGWEVELFAVDLPAGAWPAPEAITAYYGRNALENRFAQEDRELGLERIVSYHLPGQELATLVALSLWNRRLVAGFQMETPPADRPVQRLRKPRTDERVPACWPRDPVLARLLSELDWPRLLLGRPGWTFDAGDLRCDEGRSLTLTSVRPTPNGPTRTSIIFRRPTGGCEDCAERPRCFRSDRPGASKHAELSVPTELAQALRARLARIRETTKTIEPIRGLPGPRAVHDSLFLPAAARQVFEAVHVGATLRVAVDIPPTPRGPMLLAFDVADRQRRRKTWQQNVDRHALPDDARVSMEISARPELRALLGKPRTKAGVGAPF